MITQQPLLLVGEKSGDDRLAYRQGISSSSTNPRLVLFLHLTDSMKVTNTSCHGYEVREMVLDDIPKVYLLGRQLFKLQKGSTFYRTWDAYEVTNNFNLNPHLTLVAESFEGVIVGFALGTTYANESGGWKYGYILWMGVRPSWQHSGLGSQLYREMERRMHAEGVRMSFVDVAWSNRRAMKFFRRMGYGKPRLKYGCEKCFSSSKTTKIKTTLFENLHRGAQL